MVKVLFVFSLFINMAHAVGLSADEYRSISLAAPQCAGEPILYRCVRGGYFTALRVIRNMLGDERAEHTAWKLTSLMREHGFDQENIDEYHWAKREAFRQLLAAEKVSPACRLSTETGMQTTGGGNLAKSHEAWAVLASEGSGYAEDYCLWDNGAKQAVLLQLNDVYQVNGASDGSYDFTRGYEYAIPLFIPHDTIESGYTETLALYKRGAVVEVRQRNVLGFSSGNQIASPVAEKRETQALLFKLESCDETGSCVTEKRTMALAEKYIPGIETALGKTTTRFKITQP